MTIKKTNENQLTYRIEKPKRKKLIMMAVMEKIKLNWFERNIYPVWMLRNLMKIRIQEKIGNIIIPWESRK